jgi:hypothetical protein
MPWVELGEYLGGQSACFRSENECVARLEAELAVDTARFGGKGHGAL